MELFVYMHMVYVILVKKTISMLCISISLHATQMDNFFTMLNSKLTYTCVLSFVIVVA